MSDLQTVRIQDPDVPGGVIINRVDFQEGVHELYDGEEDPGDPRAARIKALKKMKAEAVKKLAADAGVEVQSKEEAIEVLVRLEFPE